MKNNPHMVVHMHLIFKRKPHNRSQATYAEIWNNKAQMPKACHLVLCTI